MNHEIHSVVEVLQQRAPYLRCATVAPASEGWICCAELIADPARLRREIDATAAGRGTGDPQVAASLYAQAYAFRVPSIAVAAFALGLPVPGTSPGSTAVRVARHRPAELAVLDPSCRDVPGDGPGVAEFVEELFEGHLAPFIAAVRAGTRIGERLLWGNTAASLATIFRAMNTGPFGDAGVRARATAFEAAAARQLRGLGEYSTIETANALGWYWTRTNCCLWYRTTSAFLCDDCSLRDPVELRAGRVADLAGSAGPTGSSSA